MDIEFYLDKFKNSADRLDKKLLVKKALIVSVGIVLESAFLKLYKREWSNDINDPLNAESRIFFSIWVNDKTIRENKLFYNIHALKLRKLTGYSISGRDFADSFRRKFKRSGNNWENVSVKFGPLTLMEGWLEINPGNFQDDILTLSDNFLKIEHLVDETLLEFKKGD